MSEKWREIWNEYGIAVKILAAGALLIWLFIWCSTEIKERQQIAEAEAAAQREHEERQAEQRRQRKEARAREREEQQRREAAEAARRRQEREAREREIAAAQWDREHMEPGDKVETYRRTAAFKDKEEAELFEYCIRQENFELASYNYEEAEAKGEACRLLNDYAYDVTAVEGELVQVRDGSSLWWTAKRWMREVED